MQPPIRINGSDHYQTPWYAVRPLLPFPKKEWLIWECACGAGNLVRGFLKEGYKVIASDILQGKNFLTSKPQRFDCMVTNPLYSLKQQFLQRAYELGKPFAFLLPLSTFETAKRQALFTRYGFEVLICNKRIAFERNGIAQPTSWFATAWFTYGLHIGKQVSFVSLNR